MAGPAEAGGWVVITVCDWLDGDGVADDGPARCNCS